MASLLQQLQTMTVTVADTGDIASIRKFTPRDATTNPSLIAAAAQMPEYAEVVTETLQRARSEAGSAADPGAVVKIAIDRLAVGFGTRILDIVPGRVSTEVDARLSFDTAATVAKAHRLMKWYSDAGVGADRVLIKIAATWEGIRAAEQLEKQGIHCNLTLLFGIHQAVACADAKVTLISPFVGRILDWHKKKEGRDFAPHEDPGVVSVQKIWTYYKRFGHKTEVMGASFRNLGEIFELAGCDLLTIAPPLLAELQSKDTVPSGGPLVRKLDPVAASKANLEKITIDEARFRALHAADPMSTDKLAEGIEGFSKAIVGLEAQLTERLRTL
jgi:transaldolase